MSNFENENLEIETLVLSNLYRGRAWRRSQEQKHKQQTSSQAKHSKSNFCLEKNWSLMYGRTEKIYRAKKLGFNYPYGRDKIHFYNI